MSAEEILVVGGLAGIAVFLIGILVANVAIFKMQKALNESRAPEKRLSPWLVLGKASFKYHPYFRYRSTFPKGSWTKVRDVAGWLVGAGGVVGFGCMLIEKVRK